MRNEEIRPTGTLLILICNSLYSARTGDLYSNCISNSKPNSNCLFGSFCAVHFLQYSTVLLYSTVSTVQYSLFVCTVTQVTN